MSDNKGLMEWYEAPSIAPEASFKQEEVPNVEIQVKPEEPAEEKENLKESIKIARVLSMIKVLNDAVLKFPTIKDTETKEDLVREIKDLIEDINNIIGKL